MSSVERVARETLAICERGSYVAPSGREVDLSDALRRAVEGTRVYTPSWLAALAPPTRAARHVEVTDETTQRATERLVREHGDVALLNFASARNPGGGFLGGARAQEEDLCRCSGLYPCLVGQHLYYYASNRATFERAPNTPDAAWEAASGARLLYTDFMIHSPRVPFFRVRGKDAPLEEPYLASVITAPAPNGEALRRDPSLGPALRETFRRRAAYVLRVAEAHGHRTLVLGAWGCGAFHNDPETVADVFVEVLRTADLERVVFAIPRAVAQNHEAFARRFA